MGKTWQELKGVDIRDAAPQIKEEELKRVLEDGE